MRAARAAILRRGLVATSLRDIAAEAGVSMGTVTYHFASVQDIRGAVVLAESERFYERVVARADAEPDAWEALRILTDPMFASGADVEDHWRIWMEHWAATARDPAASQPYALRIRHWERCCARVVARGVADGVFRSIDPDAAALRLAAYADGLATQRAQGVAMLTPDVASAWFAEFTRMLLAPSR